MIHHLVEVVACFAGGELHGCTGLAGAGSGAVGQGGGTRRRSFLNGNGVLPGRAFVVFRKILLRTHDELYYCAQRHIAGLSVRIPRRCISISKDLGILGIRQLKNHIGQIGCIHISRQRDSKYLTNLIAGADRTAIGIKQGNLLQITFFTQIVGIFRKGSNHLDGLTIGCRHNEGCLSCSAIRNNNLSVIGTISRTPTLEDISEIGLRLQLDFRSFNYVVNTCSRLSCTDLSSGSTHALIIYRDIHITIILRCKDGLNGII